MSFVTVGTNAPDFTVPSTAGTLSLAKLLEESERGVIIYFYPRAATPGCTTEACDFRDNFARLVAAGYKVVGISPDPMEKLESFAANNDLVFPLASDPEHTVMETYGAWGPKQNYGKTVIGTIRSTVVVTREGKVQLALHNVRAKGHVVRLMKQLGLDG